VTDDDLSPRERERIRRHEREARAKERAPMRAGMGKVFKQILDAQTKAARDATTPPSDVGGKDDAPATGHRPPRGQRDRTV
jgi:hypothetical protein